MRSRRTLVSKTASTRISDQPAIKQLIRASRHQEFDWHNSYVLDWSTQAEFRDLVTKHMKLAQVHVLAFRMGAPQTSELALWMLREGPRHPDVKMGFIWDAEDYADYLEGLFPEYTCYLVVINETLETKNELI